MVGCPEEGGMHHLEEEVEPDFEAADLPGGVALGQTLYVGNRPAACSNARLFGRCTSHHR